VSCFSPAYLEINSHLVIIFVLSLSKRAGQLQVEDGTSHVSSLEKNSTFYAREKQMATEVL
jgi:hypothetical protein